MIETWLPVCRLPQKLTEEEGLVAAAEARCCQSTTDIVVILHLVVENARSYGAAGECAVRARLWRCMLWFIDAEECNLGYCHLTSTCEPTF